jgi:hypothetical protein
MKKSSCGTKMGATTKKSAPVYTAKKPMSKKK